MKKGFVVKHPNQSFEGFFVITNKQKIANTFYDLLLLLLLSKNKNCIIFLQVFALSPKNAI